MNAQQKDRALAGQIAEALNPGSLANGWHPMGQQLAEHARTLRRAQLTLHRWAEEMCNGTIQREWDDEQGEPRRHTSYQNTHLTTSYKIPDRERGALARVEKVCKAAGLFYYHQTDPRGCALFVAAEPLNDQNYSTKGVACL